MSVCNILEKKIGFTFQRDHIEYDKLNYIRDPKFSAQSSQ